MKRVELLIEEVRELTGNQRYDSNTGISQYVMVRALKNAQAEMYKQIVSSKNDMFKISDSEEIPIVPGQSLYDYPEDLYLQNIETMKWSQDRQNWLALKKASSKDDLSSQRGNAFSYLLRKNGFMLVPPASNGYLKPSYIQRIPDLEKRSGKISAVTVAGGEITAITLDVADESNDVTYLNKLMRLCIVDKHGVLKVKNVNFDSIHTGTGVVTLGSNHELSDIDSTPAVGDYVTAGPWTYNTSDLPDICEPTIIKHAEYQIRYGDASKWSDAVKEDMAQSFASVIDNLVAPSSDVHEIVISNTDYL